MIKETATVISNDETGLWVKARREGQCHSCSAKQGCGHRLLNSVHSKRVNSIQVLNPEAETLTQVKAGDCITIGLEEQQILKLSLLFYVLPLLFLVVTVLFFYWVGVAELWLVIIGFLGLALGFVCVRWFSKSIMQISGANFISGKAEFS